MYIHVTTINESATLKPDAHDETFVCNFCMQLLCLSYTPVQTIKLLYATSHYLLPFHAKIMHMHKAFVNMVLTMSDCHCTCNATFKWTDNCIIRRCWTRRWIQRRNVYGARHALLEKLRNEDPKSLKSFLRITGKLTSEIAQL